MVKQWWALTVALTLGFAGSAFADEGKQPVSGQEKEKQQQTEIEKQAGLEQQAGQEVELKSLESDKVRKVQEKLHEQGFLQEDQVDGIAGKKTEQALKEFKQAQGMSQDAKIDQQTAQALGIDMQEIQPVRGEEKKQQEEPMIDDPATEPQSGTDVEEPVTDPQSGVEDPMTQPPAESDVQTQEGMAAPKQLSDLSQDQVKDLQNKLKQEGFYEGEAHGNVDEQTRAAVLQFKQANDLGQDVSIDQRTAAALGIQLEEERQPVRGEEEEETHDPLEPQPEQELPPEEGGPY